MQAEVVVAAVITKGDSILLTMRISGRNPETIGMYEAPGGKVEEGETPEQAVVREVEEEIGYKCQVIGDTLHVHLNTWSVSGRCCVLFYHCRLRERVSGGEGLTQDWRSIYNTPWDDVLPGTSEAVLELIRQESGRRYDSLLWY